MGPISLCPAFVCMSACSLSPIIERSGEGGTIRFVREFPRTRGTGDFDLIPKFNPSRLVTITAVSARPDSSVQFLPSSSCFFATNLFSVSKSAVFCHKN